MSGLGENAFSVAIFPTVKLSIFSHKLYSKGTLIEWENKHHFYYFIELGNIMEINLWELSILLLSKIAVYTGRLEPETFRSHRIINSQLYSIHQEQTFSFQLLRRL